MKVDRFVSVVAPLSDDADIVEGFVEDIMLVLREHFTNYELVLVDDGSYDDTEARVQGLLIRHEGIRYIRLSRPFGEEVAISAGLETVIGDYVVVIMGYMDPPELIPDIVACSMEGVDVVFGVKRTKRGESWIYRNAAQVFYWYLNGVLRIGLLPNSTHFRCLSRQAVNAILQIKDSHRYLRLFSSYVGYPRQEFLYDPIQRKVKQKTLAKAVNRALALIIENSPHPLRFFSVLGMMGAFCNLLYVVFIVFVYLLKRDVVEGWTTLSMQSGLQFLMTTLMLTALSEYTGRILNRLRGRPLYFIRSEHVSSVLLVDRLRPNVVTSAEDDRLHQDPTSPRAMSEKSELPCAHGETP